MSDLTSKWQENQIFMNESEANLKFPTQIPRIANINMPSGEIHNSSACP